MTDPRDLPTPEVRALERIADALELLTHRPVHLPGEMTKQTLDDTVSAMLKDHGLGQNQALPFTTLATVTDIPAGKISDDPELPPIVERATCRFCHWPIIRRAGTNRWQHDIERVDSATDEELGVCAQPVPKSDKPKKVRT